MTKIPQLAIALQLGLSRSATEDNCEVIGVLSDDNDNSIK